jgi:DNA-binding HxlR family transcriptional regulator
VLTRSRYSEHPPRYDYELTAAGRALIPVLSSLRQWGEQYATPVRRELTIADETQGADL